MPSIDFIKRISISQSMRARQLEALFDIPRSSIAEQHWIGNVPIDERPWHVGLILGPSGSGKSSVLQEIFNGMPKFEYAGKQMSEVEARRLIGG